MGVGSSSEQKKRKAGEIEGWIVKEKREGNWKLEQKSWQGNAYINVQCG